MITFILYFVPLVSTALFSWIFYENTSLPVWSMPILGLLIGILLCALIIAILFFGYMPIAKRINPRNKFNCWFLKQLAKFVCYILRIKIKVVGKENLDGFDMNNEKYIFTSNHKSLLDPIVLYLLFPGIGFIAKKEVYDMPIIPVYFKALGVIPINRENDRETAKSMIVAIKKVKSGEPMCIYTEGGIKSRETDKMVGVKPGAYKLAYKSEASIIPVSVRNNHLIAKNAPLRKTKLEVIIHKPIKYDDYKEKNTIEIGDEIMEIVNSVL